MSMSALCKTCFHYNPTDKTCGRSVVAVSNDAVHHDYAKSVRLDKKRCGPAGKWFVEEKGRTPVDELFESFDL
jgi:hypothetical protein